MKKKDKKKIVKKVLKEKGLCKYTDEELDFFFFSLLRDTQIILSSNKLEELKDYVEERLFIQKRCDLIEVLEKAKYHKIKDVDDYMKENVTIYTDGEDNEFLSKKAMKLYLFKEYIISYMTVY